MSDQFMVNYSKLILQVGIAITKKDNVIIKCPVSNYEFARVITEIAYAYGANNVIVDYVDNKILQSALRNLNQEELENVPLWKVEFDQMLASESYKVITLVAPHQDKVEFDDKKFSLYRTALIKNAGHHRELTNCDQIAWTIAALPNQEWADCVFPEVEDNFIQLQNAVEYATRLDEEDLVAKWKSHQEKLLRVAYKLNDLNLKRLHLTTKLGTNLEMGIVKDHIWKGAGANFISNLPTEEVYTMPDMNDALGTVVSSRPLIVNGKLYENLKLTFENGELKKIEGNQVDELKNLFMDTFGGNRLGEIALVDKTSKVSQLGLVLFEMLYDENAGAHIALGNSFASNIHQSENVTPSQRGQNVSDIHVDIVFGTEDLNVIGIDYEGNKIQVMKDGLFTI